MAIIVMDGFDHYPDAAGEYFASVEGYTHEHNPERSDAHSADTRWDYGKCLEIYWDGPFRIAIGNAATNTIFVSMAFKYTSAENRDILKILDANGNQHAKYHLDSSGYVYASDASGTVQGTSTGIIAPNIWYWMEMKTKVDSTTGTMQIKIDEVDAFTPLTGLNTQNGATTPLIGWVRFTSGSDNYTYFDDLIIQDDTGDFLGDSRIETFMPASDVGTPDWTNTGAGSNAADVSVIGSTMEDDYVYSATSTDVDLYDVGALSEEDTVHAVATHTRAMKDSTAAVAFKSRTKSGTNERDGASNTLVSSYAWTTYTDIFEWTDDAESIAWNKTLFDAAQFGVEVV